MNTELTNGQRNILLAMVRREARSLGYGNEYDYYNHAKWPRRLKQLDRVARKLEDTETDR